MKRTKLTLKRSTIRQLSSNEQSVAAGGGSGSLGIRCSNSCSNPEATVCEWDGTARCPPTHNYC